MSSVLECSQCLECKMLLFYELTEPNGELGCNCKELGRLLVR